MAMSRSWKIVTGTLLFVAILAASFPFLAHALVKSKIDEKLQNEFGGLAHYDSITLAYSPLGATLTRLRLGDPIPNAGNAPTVQIESTVLVLESIFDAQPHLKSVVATGCAVSIYVDEKGESSFAKLIREKKPSLRKYPLKIDALTLSGITFTTYVAGTPAPDSTIKVATASANNFTLPIPGQLLGHELWIPTTVESIDAFGTGAVDSTAPAHPAIHIDRVSFELDQAENTEVPTKIRQFKAEHVLCKTAGGPTDKSDLIHVATSVQKGLGIKEPEAIAQSSDKTPAPHGNGLWIEDFQTIDATVEFHNGDATGKAGFWRLSGAKVQATNLAFGENLKSSAPGSISLDSATESSSIPGHVTIKVTDLSGAYPRATFKGQIGIENVDASVFGALAQAEGQVKIKTGSLSMTFNGGANDGNLNFDGSVTLSSDFEVSGNLIKTTGVEFVRGKPIAPVTVDGTLEHPSVHLPPDLALLGNVISGVLAGGPFKLLNMTAGQVPGVGPIVKEGTHLGEKVLGKIPVIGGLFKGDKEKDKEKEKDKN